ncbi:hypothetical protein PM082_006683 [Marasmius tenuissimus]|nr:hypothetical protein PM082_006683 [Marasmius tenuissimus]
MGPKTKSVTLLIRLKTFLAGWRDLAARQLEGLTGAAGGLLGGAGGLDKVTDIAGEAKNKVGDAVAGAKDKVGDAVDQAKDVLGGLAL